MGPVGAYFSAHDFIKSNSYLHSGKPLRAVLSTLFGLFCLASGFLFNLGGTTMILHNFGFNADISNVVYRFLFSFTLVLLVFIITLKKNWHASLVTS
jgi:hypothetical protein